MKFQYALLSLICFVFSFCGSQRERAPAGQIEGTYVAETSFNVSDVSSGTILGTGKIRDTIFVNRRQEGFEVVNRKWRMNTYDMDGWKNLDLSTDKPMATYAVTYEPKDSTLNSDPFGFMPSLYVDLEAKKLFKGKDRSRGYVKVN